jgi:hypothetical protein
LEERLLPTGASNIVHASGAFEAQSKGWIDVPTDVGQELAGIRWPSGERWYTPAEVNEEVSLGALDDPDVEPDIPRRGPGRPRKEV